MGPTREQLQAAYGATVPDLVFPGVRVLLCGINPSLWSGWAGLHFARPSNRLWPTLHQAGLTPQRLQPTDVDGLRAAGRVRGADRSSSQPPHPTPDRVRSLWSGTACPAQRACPIHTGTRSVPQRERPGHREGDPAFRHCF